MAKTTQPTTAADHRRAMVKLMHDAAHRHQLWDVFGDFVECAALSIANNVDPRYFDEREARYLRIVKRYSAEELATFPRMLAHLVDAMTLEPGDHLGMVFGELELGNASRGQFFTPYSLCLLMAGMTIGDAGQARAAIAERGFFTVSEPACGAGAMLIAMALHLEGLGVEYQTCMHAIAVDVDSRAVHMAYIQLSLLGVPALVILGNTLTLEEREHWYTPAHILGMWDAKLRRGHALGSAADPAGDVCEIAQTVNSGQQLGLFGELA